MKAIVALTKEEHAALHKVHFELRAAIKDVPWTELFEVFQRGAGYAHYKFIGKYTSRFVELLGRHPTEDELIMLADGGFSHFGATCTINHETGEFYGRVNTD